MKSFKHLVLLGIFLSLIVSCSKKDIISPSKSNDIALVDSRFKQLKRFEYKPYILDLTSLNTEFSDGIINKKKQNTITFLRDSIWPNSLGKTFFYLSTGIPAILPDTRMKLHLGAIIRGDQALNIENFSPINIPLKHRNPITRYVNFSTDSSYRKSMPSPSQDVAYVRDALKTAGSDLEIQSFTYDHKQFKKTEELKILFGANLNVSKILDVYYLETPNEGATKTRIRADFVQENFTVAIEPPISEPFLKETVDMELFGGYDPLIVNSITYGKKGILIIESDTTFEQVNKILKEAFKLAEEMRGSSSVNIDANFKTELLTRLTNEQKSIIDNFNMSVYLIGVDEESTAQTINIGLPEFAQIIAKCGEYTPESAGVPLYFTLNYLSDFSTFKNPFQINISNN